MIFHIGLYFFHSNLVHTERSDAQSMIWTSTLQIRMHEYSDDFNFIILFVDIMLLYVINLDHVSLFRDSSFMVLAILNDVLYQFECINIACFYF